MWKDKVWVNLSLLSHLLSQDHNHKYFDRINFSAWKKNVLIIASINAVTSWLALCSEFHCWILENKSCWIIKVCSVLIYWTEILCLFDCNLQYSRLVLLSGTEINRVFSKRLETSHDDRNKKMLQREYV